MKHSAPRLVRVVLFAAPCCVVLILTAGGVRTPAGAVAAPGPAGPVSLPASPSTSLTLAQDGALECLASIDRSVPLVSPLIVPRPLPIPDLAAPVPARSEPKFAPKLTGVLGSGETALASIDGKVHRIGDEVAPGWKLVAIDAHNRGVTLTGPEGRTMDLRQD